MIDKYKIEELLEEGTNGQMTSRADLQRIMANTRLSGDEHYQQEMESLKKLERFMSNVEIAEMLYDLDDGKSLKVAVERLENAGLAQRFDKPFQHPALDEVDDDHDELENALKHRAAPTGVKAPIGNKAIVLGKNKSRVDFNGVDTRKASKSFDVAAGRVSSVQKGMSEDFLDNHRAVNNGNLEWIKRKPSASMIASVKAAALKSRANKTACENEYLGINETAMAILSAHAALKEDNNTIAARTLKTYTADEPSVRDRLPDTFKQSGLLPAQRQPNVDETTATTTQLPTTDDVAIRMPEFDTRKGLAGTEFAPKITPTTDNSFAAQAGRMKNPTAAAATRDRPKPVFKSTEDNDQGPISVNQPSAKPPRNGNPKDGVSMGARTYKTHPAQEPNQWPQEPTGDTGSNQESGRGYY
jgi:hypothetical protein